MMGAKLPNYISPFTSLDVSKTNNTSNNNVSNKKVSTLISIVSSTSFIASCVCISFILSHPFILLIYSMASAHIHHTLSFLPYSMFLVYIYGLILEMQLFYDNKVIDKAIITKGKTIVSTPLNLVQYL